MNDTGFAARGRSDESMAMSASVQPRIVVAKAGKHFGSLEVFRDVSVRPILLKQSIYQGDASSLL